MTRPETPKPRSRSSASDAAARAWDHAIRLLARQDRSEEELRSRLAADGESARTIATTIRRLRRYRYLDDDRLAAALAQRAARRGYGSEYVRAQLTSKGLPERLIEEAVRASLNGETELARRVLAQRFAAPVRSPAEHAKAARLLLRRGFSEAAVFAILDEAC